MTKKIICAFIASISSLVLASWNEGYYLSAAGGYSTAKAQLKDSTSVQLSGQNYGPLAGRSQSKGSYSVAVNAGHRHTYGRKHFSAELGVSYANANPAIGTLTANTTNAGLGLVNGQSYSFFYKPRLGISAALRFGYLFMPDLLGYFKFGLEHNLGQITLKADKETKIDTGVTYIVPGIGVESVINDRLYWLAGADYKLAIKTSNKKSNLSFKKRPHELVTKAGLGFHL